MESSATEQGGATLQTLGKVHPSENPKDCGNSNLHLRLLSENFSLSLKHKILKLFSVIGENKS